jgi:hypothetical protein
LLLPLEEEPIAGRVESLVYPYSLPISGLRRGATLILEIDGSSLLGESLPATPLSGESDFPQTGGFASAPCGAFALVRAY